VPANKLHTCDIATGSVDAGDESDLTGSFPFRKRLGSSQSRFAARAVMVAAMAQ